MEVYWTEVQSCFERVRQRTYFMQCSLHLELHKLDFRMLINETPNKWQPVGGKKCHAVIEIHVSDGILFFSDRPSLLVLGTLSTLCRLTAFSGK